MQSVIEERESMAINRDMYSPLGETKICAFRRGFAGSDPAPTHQTIQPVEYSAECVIARPWDNSKTYIAALEWLTTTGVGKIDSHYSVSYLDGLVYHNRFVFRTGEDLLAFRLKFPELK